MRSTYATIVSFHQSVPILSQHQVFRKFIKLTGPCAPPSIELIDIRRWKRVWHHKSVADGNKGADKFWIQLVHASISTIVLFPAKSGEIMKTYTLGHSQDLKPSMAILLYLSLPPAPFLPFALLVLCNSSSWICGAFL